MGIKNLNKFLKENVNESIKFGHVSELSGKRIAIDISIYMYKFASENTLIENIYLMLSIFRHYNVIPIFVFDLLFYTSLNSESFQIDGVV